MKYMLDTDTCIYIVKKKPENVLKRFQKIKIGNISISSVTLAELMHGVYKSQHPQKNKKALEEFILPLEIISFDEAASDCYGNIRTYLEKKELPIGPLDLMIAAQALSSNSILVTNNKKEFSCIPKLVIENWI